VAAIEPLRPEVTPGGLSGVPAPPTAFVARLELAALLGTGAVAVAGQPLGFQGAGGIGKTVLAAASARGDEVRRHFPDGVFWVAAGQGVDLLIDDVSLAAAKAFRAAGPHGRVLYTTRDRALLHGIDAAIQEINVLTIELVGGVGGDRGRRADVPLAPICERVQGDAGRCGRPAGSP
jgi:hypothetical protein